MVDLILSAEQRQIRDSARSFLSAHAPLSRLHGDEAARGDATLWPTLGELGWLGLGLSEAQGGLGLGAAEEMIIAIECGRVLVSPGVVGVMIGARLAAMAGELDLAAEIIAGGSPVGVALARDRRREAGAPIEVLLVDAPPRAPVCLWSSDVLALHAGSALSGWRSVEALDGAVTLAVAQLDPGVPISSTGDPVVTALADLLIAALLTGLAERATEAAVAYAQVREQFGQPIGAFQAIKHRCADMAVRSAAAAAQTLVTAVSLDDGLADAALQASIARLIASDAALANAAAAVQVHGGIGYTQDCDAQLFVKRAQLLARIGGDRRVHERRILQAHPA